MANYYRKTMIFYLLIMAPIMSLGLSSSSPSPSPSPSSLYGDDPFFSYAPSSEAGAPFSTPGPAPIDGDDVAPSPFFFYAPSSEAGAPSSTPTPGPASIDGDDEDFLSEPDLQFSNFKERWGKSYPTQEEQDYRFLIFKTTLLLALKNQKLDPTADHGATQYSDLTQNEFLSLFLGGGEKYMHNHRPLPDHETASILPTTDLPGAFIWLHSTPVTPINTDQLVIPILGDEDQIKANLIKYGPVAVGFDASFMQTYMGGISCPTNCSKQPNHGGVIVGYGTFTPYDPGTGPDMPFWRIYNSAYPPIRGEVGYLMCRDGHNVCGIDYMASTIPAALA